MHKSVKISVALAALAAVGGSAFAQYPTPRPAAPLAAPPAHHGFLHNLFHKNPAAQPMPGHMMPGRPGMMHGSHPGMMGGMHSLMGGGIVGNKNTHVYHMPGDKGAMPASQNRVFFHSEQEAMAQGYHRAGGGRMPMRGGPMMHGSPMHGMPMHGTPGTMTR